MSETTKKNEVTLTREEFTEKVVKAVCEGDFISKARVEKPEVAFMIMMTSIPLVRDIENSIFGKEEKENGTE